MNQLMKKWYVIIHITDKTMTKNLAYYVNEHHA